MRTRILAVVVLALAGAGLFLAGRATAQPQLPGTYVSGRADGLREGRAEQATIGLPASDKAAFQSGYAAGASDVFNGYDGGWDFHRPYAVVLVPGSNGVTYRIESRTELAPGTAYALCGTEVCPTPR